MFAKKTPQEAGRSTGSPLACGRGKSRSPDAPKRNAASFGTYHVQQSKQNERVNPLISNLPEIQSLPTSPSRSKKTVTVLDEEYLASKLASISSQKLPNKPQKMSMSEINKMASGGTFVAADLMPAFKE